MNFLLYQAESPRTINIISGQLIGKIPAVTLFGGFFVLILLVVLILRSRFKWPFKNIIIVIAFIAWLPLFSQFTYSSALDFKSIVNFIGASEDLQTTWRNCSIDKNHQFGGQFCVIYTFSKTIQQTIPKGSSINIFSNNLGVYFRYYLYDTNNIIDSVKADYLVLYHTNQRFLYESEKLYTISSGKKDYLGEFTVVNIFESDVAIFKRKLN